MRDPETDRLLTAVRQAVTAARQGGVTVRACMWDATTAAVDRKATGWPSPEARRTADAACRALERPTAMADPASRPTPDPKENPMPATPDLDTATAQRIHYTDPRVHALAHARHHLNGDQLPYSALTWDERHALREHARDWLRAAVAAGLLPRVEPSTGRADAVVPLDVDPGTGRPAAPEGEPLCRCGHGKDRHLDPPGTPVCRDCPGDDERSWRHPYTPPRDGADLIRRAARALRNHPDPRPHDESAAALLDTEAASSAGDEDHTQCTAQTCTLLAAVAVARAVLGEGPAR